MGLFDFLFSRPKKTFGVVRHSLTSEKEASTRENWQKIEELLKLGKPSQLRQAVIEGDKIVDGVLRELVLGSTMGERLKSARDLFSREAYNRLWEAHKIRNSLVHEAGFEPPYYVCKEAVEKLRESLVALNIRLR